MNRQRAIEILGTDISILPSGTLGGRSKGGRIYWTPKEATIEMSGDFTADQLEALAWWIRNGGKGDT